MRLSRRPAIAVAALTLVLTACASGTPHAAPGPRRYRLVRWCPASPHRAAAGLALVDAGQRVVVADSSRFGHQGAKSSLAAVNLAAAMAHQPALAGYLPAGGSRGRWRWSRMAASCW